MNKIDYVVPMVFPDDPLWRKDLQRAIGYDDSDDVRYRSWGMEDLLVQCVRRFMPWVRDIIILLAMDSQVKEWMCSAAESQNTEPRLRIVFHRDFIPEEYLPTFNSRAIEMFLHRISGLSECFLYGNDDMIPLSPLRQEEFFALPQPSSTTLLPCQHMFPKDYPDNPNNFQIACMGGLNFVASEFGIHFTNKWIKNGHSIAPILKSSCKHLWQRGQQEILRSISRFREPKNFNQYIYSWYQFFSGQYIDHFPHAKLMTVRDKSLSEILSVIADPDCGVVCINDHESVNDYQAYALHVRKAIEQKLLSTADDV